MLQQQRVVQAEQEAEQVIYSASTVINQKYSGELRSALDAQERKYKEYDEMQEQKLHVYRDAWGEYEHLRVLCQHEAESAAAERFGLAIQNARLMSREDGFPARQGRDSQAIAEGIDIQLRAQLDRELAHVHSQTKSF